LHLDISDQPAEEEKFSKTGYRVKSPGAGRKSDQEVASPLGMAVAAYFS
jgi:hypothetical protein